MLRFGGIVSFQHHFNCKHPLVGKMCRIFHKMVRRVSSFVHIEPTEQNRTELNWTELDFIVSEYFCCYFRFGSKWKIKTEKRIHFTFFHRKWENEQRT